MGKGTFFYAHGAGNRENAAVAYAAQLRAGLGLSDTPERLVHSNWGAACLPDPAFPDVDKALPETPMGIDEEIEPAAEDSLAPLRALAAPAGIAAAGAGPSRHIAWLIDVLRAGVVDVEDLGLSQASLSVAADEIASSPELAAAGGSDAELTDAVLASIVARALEIESAAAPGVDGLSIDDISGRIKDVAGAIANRVLGATTSAIGGWLGPKLAPGALLAISRRAASKRSAMMHSSQFLVPADVLFYQRRGAEARAHLRGELSNLTGPVVALGHSLGGIALVDALFGPDAPPDPTSLNVALLVTFGSQSAMLRSFGAIDAVNPGLPWLNIWTLYDFVSFRISTFWPSGQDVEIPIEVGFPDSHGAYFTTPAFYDAISANPIAAQLLA